ncbi:MAG: endonuclease/exonuclease/phosphatase family protein [Myxococcota bacterium]|nr:endonuclease/exonuclease/phosphatase family protein [Myxococcota bacterium]
MPDRVRIVSYNVRYFGNALGGLASTPGIKRRIAHQLLSLDPLPDLICLQEVETLSLRSSLASRRSRPGETQLEQFMVRMNEKWDPSRGAFPYEAFYFRAHTYKVGELLPIYTTGLAVVVNTQRLKVEGHNAEAPDHITYHHTERFKDRKQSRICAHLQLRDSKGRPFHIFNTHLSLPTPFTKGFWSQKDKMGHGPNQVHEARSLVGFVKKHSGDDPFVVCGDFNSPPGSPVYRFLTEECGLCSAQQQLGQIDGVQPRAFPTAGFMHLRMHLDHLFSGGAVQWLDLEGTQAITDPRCAFKGMSDHVPLIGRFELRPRG